MLRILFALFALLAGVTPGLHAQRIPAPLPAGWEEATTPPDPGRLGRGMPSQRPSTVALLAGGLLGGAVGVFTGAVVGGKATEDDCEDCVLEGVVYGGVAGGSALLPLGVHIANGRRGGYAKSLLASLAIGGAGLGAALAANEGGVLVVVPVLQLVSSILIERGTSR
jgi:hypothetical protein